MIKQYKVFIYDNDTAAYIDYSDKLQLPFTITEKSNDVYDFGNFTLKKLERETPFEVETLVKIEIYEKGRVINTYYMEIDEDEVTSYYIGLRKYFIHSINIIELTKKLDRLFLPDFTITNPATRTILKPYEAVQSEYDIINYGNTLWKAHSFDVLQGNDTTKEYDYLKVVELINFNQQTYDKGFPDAQPLVHTNGSYIELPKPHGGETISYTSIVSFNSRKTTRILGLFEDTKNYASSANNVYEIYTVTLKYYYKNINDTEYTYLGYLNVDNRTSFIANNNLTHPRVSVVNSIPYFQIGVDGDETVDIKIEVLIRDPGISPQFAEDYYEHVETNWEKEPFNFNRSIFECYDKYYKTEGAPYYNENVEEALSYLNPDNTDTMNDPYIAGLSLNYLMKNAKHNISSSVTTNNYVAINTYEPAEIGNSIVATATVRYSSTENITESLELTIGNVGYKSVKDVLEKINILLDPEDRFTIDPAIDSLLTKEVPERIYSKRNASEILFELGTLIECYPYLTENNVLTFKKINPIDNPLYEDKKTTDKIVYTSENAVNEYITNMNNMVSTPDSLKTSYSYWPSKYDFAYPNGKWENRSITPDTNQIEISNSTGLYYLKYIKVKNCLKSKSDINGTEIYGPDTVIDLTDFCPEENYYNTLYVKDQGRTSNTNKSNCIFWKKGSNIINLDALEAVEKSAIWGEFAPERYKISRAIRYAANLQVDPGILDNDLEEDTTKFQYQICYIDSIDGIIKNKKFNQTSFNNIVSNYNQTDNNISSQDWSNTAQINILRRGNDNLNKTVYINDLDTLPKLGEIKYIEGVKYLADSVTYSFDNTICSVSLNYTKDYNKIDPNITLNKEYRQFEIYGKETVTRSVNIDRYLYIDTQSKVNDPNGYDFTGAYRVDKRQKAPSYAVAFFKDRNKNLIRYNTMTTGGEVVVENSSGVVLPVTYTASGNNIIFQANLLDNFAAGYYSDINGTSLPYFDVFGNEKESGARNLKDARYVDDLGEAEYVSFYLIKDEYSTNIFDNTIYPKTTVTEEILDNSNWILDSEKDILIKKDNREKIKFIYQIHYLTHNPSLRWNPAICKYLFYDQEDINSIFNEEGEIASKNYTSYYALTYNMLNDAQLPLRLDTEGKIALDESKSTLMGQADITSEKVSNFTAVVSENTTGAALVYPKTFEVIYHVDNISLDPNSVITVPTLYFNFFKTKQKN